MTREVCKACGRVSRVGFWVPEEIWKQVMGERQDVLCVACFTERADDAAIRWDSVIEFYPVSILSHINFDYEQVQTAFFEGIKEGQRNRDVTDAEAWRATDGYIKFVNETQPCRIFNYAGRYYCGRHNRVSDYAEKPPLPPGVRGVGLQRMNQLRAVFLQPCPFCGSESLTLTQEVGCAYIECDDCMALGPPVEGDSEPVYVRIAIEAWNARSG